MRHGLVRIFTVCVLVLSVLGCGILPRSTWKPAPPPEPKQAAKPAAKPLSRMGFTIQAGAFSNVKNAARLTDALRKQGLDAYYFKHDSQIYKVRFGNFPTDTAARKRADSLQHAGVINEYYIVNPRDFTASHQQEYGTDYLREKLVATAETYLGVPYLWGGTNREDGLDCSGLTMAVYQHNGLVLPRSSLEQSEAGLPVERDELRKGDLIFFSIQDAEKISHVGVYTGDGQFIHAPSRGKVICRESLANGYFAKRYAGGRTYLSVAEADR